MNATHPSTTARAGDAPLQIELRFLLRMAPEEVFDLVTFRLPEWFGDIHQVAWDHSHSYGGTATPGVCSERICRFGNGTLREEIVSFDPGRSYAYRADMMRSTLKMPLKDHLGSFTIEPEDGGSLVTWKQYFRPRWFMPGVLLRWQMRDRLMRPAISALIQKHGGSWHSNRPGLPFGPA